MALEHLNKEFVKGRVLKASELNEVVSKVNETVDAVTEKVGATFFDVSTMRQLQFRTVEDREAWLNGGGDSYILRADQFAFTGTVNQLKVTDEYGSRQLYFTTAQERADITVGFISQSKGITDTSWREVYEDFRVTVSVDRGSSGSYVNILTDELVLNGNTLTFDIKKYIGTGNNRVRVVAVGETTGEVGTAIYSATLTTMYLSAANFTWWKPFVEGTAYALGGVNIGGNIPKVVKVRVTGQDGYDVTSEENIGTATYTTSAYFFRSLPFPSSGTGTYRVDMWVETSGLESDHLVYNIMCIASSEALTAQAVCINEVVRAVNGTDSALFRYAVYSHGDATASPTVRLLLDDGSMIREEVLVDVPTSTAQTFSAALEVESEAAEFSLTGTITLGASEVSEVVKVDNSASFPAVAGAAFYMNAATRSNTQSNRESVVNEVNASTYQATWTNMAWVDGMDGWTEDASGRKCLLIPASSLADIRYQPLVTAGEGKTIEIAYKVANAADYEENIITIATNPEQANFRGVRIKPKRITVHSQNLYTNDNAQSYPTKDEELVHLVITMVRNYKINYGNICTIYVNGVKKCSFEFSETDSFVVPSNLIMGSSSADLYVYKMRVYNNGFGWQDAAQNYINCLPGMAEKVAAYTKLNSVLDDSFRVDYDAVFGKRNTMVIEMKDDAVIPDLLNPNGGACDLWINILDPVPGELDEDFTRFFSGMRIAGQTVEGQGTTAMTYYRWNFRWKMDKAYNKRRITAKKNVASSMQDHKMGATRMFNDIHDDVVGPNEVGKRVAVFQYPVYGFERRKMEGSQDEYTYTFIGLYTIGPDKGDKPSFGFDSKTYADTLIHLEGTDHTPVSVGMEYPWLQTRYDATKEAMGASLSATAIDAAWEVGAAGQLEPDSLGDQAAVQSMLDAEFRPAYEVAYHNSTFIEGITETLTQINASVDEWIKRTNADGKSYSKLEFWTDGVYDLYYYNRQEKVFMANGVNLLIQLGISASSLSGMSLAAKNELFKTRRREKFKAEMGQYWHQEDSIYHYTFCMMFAATDNFKKNTYPYKFASLASGGKWRWRQDDLDTLFDINNQGFSAKSYSVLVGDQTSSGSGSVFRGDDSVFWTLVKECFKDEVVVMAHRILDAMAARSSHGQNKLEKIVGYIRQTFWDKAQDYFTKSAYNADAEWTYEEAWYLKNQGVYTNDVHPLQQSLGSHYEAERDWVELRTIFLASYFGYGPFATDNGQDTSTGQISFRSTNGKTYAITPAIDFNPTILIGQSSVVSAQRRVMAGEVADVVVPDMGDNDTHIYIQGADYYASLGDLADLSVSLDNPVFTVSSKRLRSLKVGDATASKVSSNVQTLSVGACPSLEVVDARNLKSLSGAVDLGKCPRLKSVLFQGTAVSSLNIPQGSKLEELSLPDTLATLSLIRLLNLKEENLSFGTMADLSYLRLENNANMDGFEILLSAYKNSDTLRSIRVTGIDYEGRGEAVAMIADLATAVDENGNRKFVGIGADGYETDDIPVLDGKFSAVVAYRADAEKVQLNYPKFNLSIPEYYFEFADAEVRTIIAELYGDGYGTTLSQMDDVSIIRSFVGNKKIKTFMELPYFKNVNILSFNQFQNSSLESIDLSNIKEIERSIGLSGAFMYCSSLKCVLSTDLLEEIPKQCFEKCSELDGLNLENVKVVGERAFYQCGKLANLKLGSLLKIGSESFYGCILMQEINLSNIQDVPYAAFRFCSSLSDLFDVSNITSIGESAFEGCRSLGSMEFLSVESIGKNAFALCESVIELTLSNIKTIGESSFPSSIRKITLSDRVEMIGYGAFNQSLELEELLLPTAVPPTLNGGNRFPLATKIYVPDESVEAYKTADVWTNFASQIYGLSTYSG